MALKDDLLSASGNPPAFSLLIAQQLGTLLNVPANKVLVGNSANVATISYAGSKIQKINILYSQLVDATAVLFGEAIPDKAIVKQVYINIKTAFTGDGNGTSTIKLGINNQNNDVVAAAALTNWGAGMKATLITGLGAAMVKNTAARQLACTLAILATDTALTAGEMDVFVEWDQGT